MVWKTPIFGCMERMDICCCSCFVGPLFAGTFFLKKMSNIFHSLVWKKINTNFKQKMQNQSVKIRCFGLWQVLLLVERVFFGVWSERSMVSKVPLLWILLVTCKSTYYMIYNVIYYVNHLCDNVTWLTVSRWHNISCAIRKMSHSTLNWVWFLELSRNKSL